jgi:hypothetical protein
VQVPLSPSPPRTACDNPGSPWVRPEGRTGREGTPLTSDVMGQEVWPAGDSAGVPHGAGEGEGDVGHMENVLV